MSKIEAGSVVMAHLTGRLDSGEVFDSSVAGEPVELRIGAGLLLKGFEEALLGMTQGEKKTFTVPAAAAYGPRDETLERRFSRSELPAGYKPKTRDILAIEVPGGPGTPIRVKRVDKQGVVADLNHPLAGQDLTYDVEIIDVRPAPAAKKAVKAAKGKPAQK